MTNTPSVIGALPGLSLNPVQQATPQSSILVPMQPMLPATPTPPMNVQVPDLTNQGNGGTGTTGPIGQGEAGYINPVGVSWFDENSFIPNVSNGMAVAGAGILGLVILGGIALSK